METRDLRRTTSRSRLAILTLGLAVGCGDGSDTTGGAGGGGTGGSAGAAGAPSDGGGSRDVVAPAAQGSVSLYLVELPPPLDCTPGRHWVNAPSPPVPTQAQRQQTSGTEIGPRAVDGIAGSQVECTVRKSNDKFVFSADIVTPRTDGTTALHPTVLHFEAPSIAPNGPVADGVITVMDDTTMANYIAERCLFTVTPLESAPELAVDSGKIWASVTCGLLADPASPNQACRIDAGFIVFENCAQ
jgi:hypothetical protein